MMTAVLFALIATGEASACAAPVYSAPLYGGYAFRQRVVVQRVVAPVYAAPLVQAVEAGCQCQEAFTAPAYAAPLAFAAPSYGYHHAAPLAVRSYGYSALAVTGGAFVQRHFAAPFRQRFAAVGGHGFFGGRPLLQLNFGGNAFRRPAFRR